MGTHLIPRANVKGQDRLFIFFSFQGLIGTLIGGVIGMPFYAIMKIFQPDSLVNFLPIFLGGLIGFTIGQVQAPENNGNQIFKKIGGLYIRDCLIYYFRFRGNKKKYVLRVSENDVFEEHEESRLEKLLLNKHDEKDVTE